MWVTVRLRRAFLRFIAPQVDWLASPAADQVNDSGRDFEKTVRNHREWNNESDKTTKQWDIRAVEQGEPGETQTTRESQTTKDRMSEPLKARSAPYILVGMQPDATAPRHLEQVRHAVIM